MALESRRGFVPERIPAWVDVWTYGNMSIGREPHFLETEFARCLG
jgi:hypothetical protein